MQGVSYDLYLFAPEPGVEPLAFLERETPPDPAETVRMHRLAETVLATHPAFEQGLTRADFIQIMADDGPEVGLQPASATITFPYWDSLDAEQLARDVDAVVAAIQAETGWKLYDPQLDRYIETLSGTPEFQARFDEGRAVVREATMSAPEPEPEPQPAPEPTPAPAPPATPPAVPPTPAPAPAPTPETKPKPGLFKRLFGGG
jgi:hypothetical protein